LEKESSFGFLFPKLLEDWDYSINEKSPFEYAPYSKNKAHWVCHVCGYRWVAVIGNRTMGRGCPSCSNRVLVQGKNDLATTHPYLCQEWDYEKNAPLLPSQVMHGTSRKAWWICPKGHSYQSAILHRSGNNGTGCPICHSGRQTSFREQAFFYYVSKLYPDAISRFRAPFLKKFEIDIYLPQCRFGIEYDGVAWHKENKIEREVKKYQICKENGIKLIRIKEKMPPLSFIATADEMYSVENIEDKQQFEELIHRILERLSFFNFYRMHPLDVNVERDRFKIQRCVMNLKKTFQDEYPELAKEWHPTKNLELLPNMFKPKSNFKAWWLCKDCQNEYEETIIARATGRRCPVCAIEYQGDTYRMNAVEKKGGITNELLLQEWNYEKNGVLLPKHFTRASEKKVWWKCSKCGYEWMAKISNREHGRGCPCCAHRVVVKGVNDLESQFPHLAKEWNDEKNGDLRPCDFVVGSNKSVWWKCSVCQYEYQAPINRRTSQNSGCRKCADSLMTDTAIQKRGSFAENYPNLLKEYSTKNAMDPHTFTKCFNQRVLWQCSVCGHEWYTTPLLRSKGRGCPVCGRKKAIETRKANHSKE